MMFIGVDLGGEHARAGLVKDGMILGEIVERNHSGYDALDAIDEVIAGAGKGLVHGIGIAVPGLYEGTVLTKSGNLEPLVGADLDRYGIPLVLLHDISALRLGEELHGEAKWHRSVTAMNFGSGISVCFSDRQGKAYRPWCEDDQHKCTREFYRNGRSWEETQHALGAKDIMLRYAGKERTLEELWRSESLEARDMQEAITRDAEQAIRQAEQTHHSDIYVLGGGQARVLAQRLLRRMHGFNIVPSENYVAAAIVGAAETAKTATDRYRASSWHLNTASR